jgi:Protein tyrosine and serine/threonine kinase
MNSAHKRSFVRTLTCLSEKCGLYPDSLILNDVTSEFGRRASGGSADVYRGVCLGEDIALKVFKYPLPSGVDSLNSLTLSDDRIHNFLLEFITWRQLSHPNILLFYGVHFLDFHTEIRLCLVSLWMENGNIVEFLARQDRRAPNTDATDCVSLVRKFHKCGIACIMVAFSRLLISHMALNTSMARKSSTGI